MLTGTGLGDHTGLAQALGQQRLTEHVVDLVRAGVVQILALEEDARTTGVLGEPRHLGDRGRAAGVRAEQMRQLGPELRIGDRLLVRRGQLIDRGDERLGHETPAELTEEGAVLVAQAHHASRKLLRVATGSPVTSASPIKTTSAPAER